MHPSCCLIIIQSGILYSKSLKEKGIVDTKEGGAMTSQNLNVHVQATLADSSPEASIDKINWTYNEITIMWITGEGILLTHLCPPNHPTWNASGTTPPPWRARWSALPCTSTSMTTPKDHKYSSCTTLKCLKKIRMVVLHFCESTTRIMNNSDLMQNQQIHGNFTKSPFSGENNT